MIEDAVISQAISQRLRNGMSMEGVRLVVSNTLHSHQMRRQEKDVEVLEQFPTDEIARALLLMSLRSSGDECDIFCGYYEHDGVMKAVFVSPLMNPVILLNQEIMGERIANLKKLGISADQSEKALAQWPS